MESEFLFQNETRELIYPFLRLLYTQIIETGEVFIEVDASNIIAAKLFAMPQEPPLVEAFDVPTLTVDYSILASLSLDITIRHVIQFIDGDSTISEIAGTYPGMDIDIVKRAIRTLLHYKCVYISDKLKFTNVYELMATGTEFVAYLLQQQQTRLKGTSSENMDSSSQAVVDMSHDHNHIHDAGSIHNILSNGISSDKSGKLASFSLILQQLIDFCSLNVDNKVSPTTILTLLAQFRPNRQLAEIILYIRSHIAESRINIRKFLVFCVYHGLLRRVHEYPIDLVGVESGTGTLIETEIPSEKASQNQNQSGSLVPGVSHPDLFSYSNLTTGVQSHQKSTGTMKSSQQQQPSRMHTITVILNGDEHLDSLCCKHRINPKSILSKQEVTIVYK